MEALTRRHFYHHSPRDRDVSSSNNDIVNEYDDYSFRSGNTNHVSQESVSEDEIDSCHWCQLRSFASFESFPITILNDTGDGATIPPNFRFISESILGPGVEKAEEGFQTGCECKNDRDCMYSGCHCLGELVDSSDEGEESDYKKKIAYHSSGKKKGFLRDEFVDSREPIYECHDLCSCSAACPNRVVERGRTVPLQIFRTMDGRGWGQCFFF